jgi:hypothetical protein
LAKILLEKQVFPDANLRTYDDTGWTMGLMTHTKVVESADINVLKVPVEPVEKMEVKGSVTTTSSAVAYAVLDNGSVNMATLRFRLATVPMRAAEKSFTSGSTTIPAGSFIVDAKNYDKLKTAVEALGLTAVALSPGPSVPMHDLDLPRVAVYSTWGNTQEVGWVRYAFDHYETPYELIFKERIKKGNLRAAYDVIVVPNQGRSGKGLVYDIEPKSKPVAYTKTEQFKFLGDYGSSEDITGGMGLDGVVEFQKFVDEGGLLVTLGVASAFPPEFGITRKVEAARTSAQFYAPGPIVNAEVLNTSHPVFYGYTDKMLPVRWANGPLLTVSREDREHILMRFPGGDQNVLSGLMKGANEISGRPAIVDTPVGKGHVLLFATNPSYRWQNLGEFRMLFNALLNYNDFNPK